MAEMSEGTRKSCPVTPFAFLHSVVSESEVVWTLRRRSGRVGEAGREGGERGGEIRGEVGGNAVGLYDGGSNRRKQLLTKS